MNQKYNPGDVLDVKIEKMVPRGSGLAFAEDLTLFVPLAVPGDHVRVRINRIKRRTSFAEIVTILEPGPDRIDPACVHFGICGGCDFQQLNYRAQLSAKADIIRDCLHRIGKIDIDEVAVIGSPQEFGYRSRAKWHLDRMERAIGYFKRDSHDVVNVEKCPILTPEAQSVLDDLATNIDWAMLWDDTAEVEAVCGDGGRSSIFSGSIPEMTDEVTVTVAGEEFSFSARSFFQANRLLAGQLVETALGGASGSTALDLYCGVGLFAIPLARKFERVIGVEDNSIAVGFAKKNAARSGLKNIEFRRSGVRDFLRSSELASTDLILIDPPRAGAEKGVIETIAGLRPKQISYVSCEPSILARDLRILLDAGYRIDTIVGLDLFPQTHHVETVVRLVLN